MKRWRVATVFPTLILAALASGSRGTDEAAGAGGADDIRALAGELRSADWTTRSQALETVARRFRDRREGDDFSSVVEPLLDFVGWGGIGRKEARIAQGLLVRIGEPAVPRVLDALRSEEARLRWSAAEMLAEMPAVRGRIVEILSPLLADKDAYVRRIVIERLGRLGGDARQAAPLLAERVNRETPFNALCCREALIRIGERAAPHVEGIAAFLTHDDPDIRNAAASMLGRLGPSASSATAALLERLDDTSPQVRVEAAGALGRVGADSDEVVSALTDALQHDPSTQVRRSAAGSLGEIGPRASAALPALRKAVDRAIAMALEKNPESAGEWGVAVDALAAIGGVAVTPTLIEALGSPDDELRYRAVLRLAEFGSAAESALPRLRMRLTDDRQHIRQAAARAVQAIDTTPR